MMVALLANRPVASCLDWKDRGVIFHLIDIVRQIKDNIFVKYLLTTKAGYFSRRDILFQLLNAPKRQILS
jgi:hypothetical protein